MLWKERNRRSFEDLEQSDQVIQSFFFINKEKYIKRKEALQGSTLAYTGGIQEREREKKKKTFNQGLTNQQNLQRKGDQNQKTPWSTPTDYKGKMIYTHESNAPHFQTPYGFFHSKQSKKGTRELKTTLSSFPFPHKAQTTPMTPL